MGNKQKSKKQRSPSFVIKVILYHSLRRHFGLNANDIMLILDPMWSLTPRCLAHSKQIGDLIAFSSLNKAYVRLESVLKSICCNKSKYGVPLRLKQISRMDSFLWNLSICPPQQKNVSLSSYSLIDGLEPMHICLKFEQSDCWPNKNGKALNHVKLAFFIQIHRALQMKKIRSLLSKQYLDVILNGFAFRCFICADTEFQVYKFEQLRLHRYRFNFLPKLGLCLEGISKNFAYFSPTLSLIKRWLACNLFSDLIDIHLIEVLTADLFVNSAPFGKINSAFCGFLRFLNLLQSFEWLETPYIAELGTNSSILSKSIASAPTAYQFSIFRTKMLNLRQNDDNGLHCMFVVVPGLENTSKWTQKSPTLHTLDRLLTASKNTLQYVTQLISTSNDKSDNEFLRVFKPQKNAMFDFIINLRAESMPNYMRNTWKRKKGKNEWKRQQILKRMNRINIEKEKKTKNKKN